MFFCQNRTGKIPQISAAPCARSLLMADRLPIDVLCHICSYIPAGPRLRCLTLVCKRFGVAATRLVYYAMFRGGCNVWTFCRRFPNLTDLTISTMHGPPHETPIALPASLQRLSIRFCGLGRSICFDPGVPLPSLRTLSITYAVVLLALRH